MSQNTCKARNINTFKRFQDMTRILFVCHGNICRSPMAEFVMKDLVSKAGLEDQFYIGLLDDQDLAVLLDTHLLQEHVHDNQRNKREQERIIFYTVDFKDNERDRKSVVRERV